MLVSTLIFLTSLKSTLTTTHTIGYLTGSQRRPGDFEYPRPGLTISGAISLAVSEINNGPLKQLGHRLDFIVAETYGEEKISVKKTADLWAQNISVYIGPQETCEHEAFMAAAFNIPMISYFCTHYRTSDKSKFPTFARTRPPDTQISKSVASVLVAFNWTHVVLLYLKSSDFEFESVAKSILQSLSSAGVTVIAVKHWETPYHHGYMNNPFHELVDEIYKDARIFVILGHHYEHLGLMIAMEEKKLFDKGEYFVIGVDIEQYDHTNPKKYLHGLLRNDIDPIAEKAYRSYIGVVPSSPVGFENFTQLVNLYMEKPPFNYVNPLTYVGGEKRIRAEAAYLYDAVHLYANALMKTLRNNSLLPNGTTIINEIKKTQYKSAMGYMVYIDENGDAEGNYTLIARKPYQTKADFNTKSTSNEYGLLPVGVFALRRTDSNLPVLHMVDEIDWISGSPPIAVPQCGFRGEKCISYTIEITTGIAGGLFLIFLIILFIFYRNWKYKQELDSLLWKIEYKDIQMHVETNLTTKNAKPYQPLIRTSQMSLSSNLDAEFRYTSIFTQIGIYKGRVLAIKKINKKSIDLTRKIKQELKMMRDIRHDNLNGFVGACTDPPNICIVTEYCTRGSLKDILENGDVKLDNMFIASLVEDILRGMIYLHDSPIRFHGSLNTSNCLVDSRWVVKIADYGLWEFKKGALDLSLKDPMKIREKIYNALYRAPELLRCQESYLSYNEFQYGSQKGDVYSFGMILYELHSRKGPFGDLELSSVEILNRIINCTNPKNPFRPPLATLEPNFDFLRNCLKECWIEIPEDRPDFKAVRSKLRPLRKGIKPNIFDNMIAMMEKYANNLEVLVDERTHQLQEEKKKTDTLLYEMLPRSVAEQLKKGQKVEAESFDSVTIYFSDIVGFTAMSAESTPLEVVDFLNDLYTCFDSIIQNYDVYKVETIGDAYMVVSGLPIKNGYRHAAEIATMSLRLLSEITKFSIRHRPKETLMLRIGIHSGPVCAGVVGIKMPRYCLFGDTVNTASRMESTGIPLKIHCSKECKEILTKIGGYQLLERGFVQIKGKGNQKTYWLVGEDLHYKKIREEERERRRVVLDEKNCENIIVTKSSLSSKNFSGKPVRCSSFENPKRIRFASGDNLFDKNNSNVQNVNGNPINKEKLFISVIENSLFDLNNSLLASSVSCPCIRKLTNSTAALLHSQLSMLYENNNSQKLLKTTCNSVPMICSHFPLIHTLSAPSSPSKQDLLLSKFSECEEVIPWIDSTPLLKITKPVESEACV